MKKLLIFPIFFFMLFSCTENKKAVIESTGNKEEKLTEIQITFSENIVLNWDVVNEIFIQDSNYKQLTQDRKKIKTLVENISDSTSLKIGICSKNTVLKKGDIAFIFLYETGEIAPFTCLKIQFDYQEEKCKIPQELLNYVEHNRKEVEQKVKNCIHL